MEVAKKVTIFSILNTAFKVNISI